jgi:UTP--glucose-1-phosphate uridylyltransferase
MVISGVKIEKKADLKRYGIADLEHVDGNVYKIKRIVEKPEPEEAPSDIATHGAYILPPEIFSALKRVQPGKGGEIWLTDGINLLNKEGVPLYTVVVENGKYYDTGNKLEYMKTVIDLAMKHDEIGEDFKEYIKAVVKALDN